MKKLTILTLVLLCFAVLLVSCNGGNGPQTDDPTRTTGSSQTNDPTQTTGSSQTNDPTQAPGSSASPNEEDTSKLEFTLSTDGTSYSVTGIGECTDTDIVIPATYKGLTVTEIGERAFESCSNITSIVIPNSVTSIGTRAFWSCSMTSVVIPNSVTTIGNHAFYNCFRLTSITIPENVRIIGSSAFGACWSLQYYAYDNGLYLGNEKNSYLVLVGVSSTSITSCTIHEETKIVCDAFQDCTDLTNITIPNGVQSIGKLAFYRCSSLTNITIPDSVTSIGDDAFFGCTGLTSITIPNSVTSIGTSAFYECTSLTSIVIPDGVTSIGDHTFYGCSNLTDIVIPDSVTSIGNYAFSGCKGLTSIQFDGTKAQWSKISKGSYWNANTGSYTVTCTDGTLTKAES
ncbi:MAG: leucine-rich repeat domain-containing protein [Clostridia bacterium]|nr:leucine-rich repeat domain-containing protein [Clostridia bacterium]